MPLTTVSIKRRTKEYMDGPLSSISLSCALELPY